MKKYLMLSFVCLAFYSIGMAQTEPKTAIDVVDEYFEHLSTQSEKLTTLFTPIAGISSVVYDTAGQAKHVRFNRDSYLKELQKTATYYDYLQEPVVIINRSYGVANSIYASVYMKFVSKDKKDTLESKSVQSFKLLFINNQWLIDHVSIQNEIPGIELDDYLWPEELTKQLAKTAPVSKSNTTDFVGAEYDASKLYKVNEVDEVPVYPGGEKALKLVFSKYGVSQPKNSSQETGSPFLLEISEDGGAKPYYINDLSGTQILQVKKMCEQMDAWYPALKDKASVRCRIKLFIK
jgi:hypothetical protein